MMTREATLGETKGERTGSRRALRVALGALALIVGMVCLALGGAVFSSAHDTHPVQIDGTVADYHEITINGAYARNELRLTGDPHTYTFDSRQLHPTLPPRFQKDARIQIWVDKGTTNVLAITLYNEMGLNPTAYTTGAYDNPTIAFATTEGEAGVLAALGVALMIAGGLSLLLRGKRRAAPGARRAAPQPAPVGFGPAYASRSAAPQGYPSQPIAPPPTAPPPFAVPSTAPGANGSNGSNGAFAPAIPLAQAAPTTPAPNRRPPPEVGVDQLPTQKTPAVPIVAPALTPPPGATQHGPSLPGTPSAPGPVQPGSMVEGAGAPWAAWGIAPELPASATDGGAPPPAIRPPSLQPVPRPDAPPAIEHPQASAPPGSLPDFPTEHMPASSGATTPPASDVSDEPTRKSESVTPPDLTGQGA